MTAVADDLVLDECGEARDRYQVRRLERERLAGLIADELAAGATPSPRLLRQYVDARSVAAEARMVWFQALDAASGTRP